MDCIDPEIRPRLEPKIDCPTSGFRKYLHKTFNLRQYFVLIGNFPLASMDISHKRQTFSREPIAKYLVLYSTQQTESSHSKFLQNFSFVMINESTEF